MLQNQKGRPLGRFFHSFTLQAKFWFLALVPIAAGTAVLFLAVASGQTQDTIKVNLHEKSGISPVQLVSAIMYIVKDGGRK